MQVIVEVVHSSDTAAVCQVLGVVRREPVVADIARVAVIEMVVVVGVEVATAAEVDVGAAAEVGVGTVTAVDSVATQAVDIAVSALPAKVTSYVLDKFLALILFTSRSENISSRSYRLEFVVLDG